MVKSIKKQRGDVGRWVAIVGKVEEGGGTVAREAANTKALLDFMMWAHLDSPSEQKVLGSTGVILKFIGKPAYPSSGSVPLTTLVLLPALRSPPNHPFSKELSFLIPLHSSFCVFPL